MDLLKVTMALGGVVALAACGAASGAASGPASTPSIAVTVTSQPVETPNNINPVAADQPHGILLVSCAENGGLSVASVDPSSGGQITQIASWQLEDGEAIAFGCGNDGGLRVSGWLERQQFNQDFTAMAVEHDGQAAEYGRDGQLTLLGPSGTSGYGAATPAEDGPLFRPGTDELWYADRNQHGPLYRVLPDGTAARQKLIAPIDCPTPGCNPTASFGFSADGKVINVANPDLLFNPAGTMAVGRSGGFEVATAKQVGRAGNPSIVTIADPLNTSDFNAPGCLPEVFVSSRTFICDNTSSNMYAATANRAFSAITSMRTLLPDAKNVTNDSAVLSPDGSTIAFLSMDDANQHFGLYTVPVTGGTPQEITDLASLPGLYGTKIMSWS